MSVSLHPRVLELLSSKICHDLVSPVGAVNNGIELMRDFGAEMANDAVDLIESSIEQASIRLKMFRLVYGSAGSENAVSMEDMKDAFESWMKSGRNTVAWEGDIDLSNMPKGFTKVVLNLLMLAGECNPGDGSISTVFSDNGAIINIEGKKPSFHDGMDKCLLLDFPIEELDPRLVHAYVTGAFAKHFGFSIEYDNPIDTKMVFTLKSA